MIVAGVIALLVVLGVGASATMTAQVVQASDSP
jgi:hypothetical protein